MVAIKPEVKTEGAVAKAAISGDHLKKALEQAAPAANGRKQIIVEVPKQANVSSYEVQLPTQSLKSQENYVLLIKTDLAAIEVPSNMLSSAAVNTDTVSIRVNQASMDNLNTAARDRIGNRPVMELNVIAGGQAVTWNNPNAPVKVTVPYKPAVEELGHTDSLVVWYRAANGSMIAIPNGRYDAASGALVFQTTYFGTYAAAYNPYEL